MTLLAYLTAVATPQRSGSRADRAPRWWRPGTPMATKELCSAGGPIHYAVFFCTDDGFGIEKVQALDEAHAVDIVQAVQSGAVARAVPAALLDGKNKQRLLWDWMDAQEQSVARSCGLRARAPGRLTPRSAADCAPAAGPAPAATSGDRH
jgi:hypothetical protein